MRLNFFKIFFYVSQNTVFVVKKNRNITLKLLVQTKPYAKFTPFRPFFFNFEFFFKNVKIFEKIPKDSEKPRNSFEQQRDKLSD